MSLLETQEEIERIKQKLEQFKLGSMEEAEHNARGLFVKFDYPKPFHKYRLVIESYEMYVEEAYFWMLSNLREDAGYVNIKKITDVFAASEASSFWGSAQQRLQITQSNIASYLKYIHDMVQTMIRIVNDLRIIDERLEYYQQAKKGMESAIITLKGYWTDIVEGGRNSPASVTGLASQVGFGTLPDLFFSTHPKTAADIDKVVDNMKFNQQVRTVLKRKLHQFNNWFEKTYEEIKRRRAFTLKYLGQHYQTINMYIKWVKPYLIQARRLSQHMGKVQSPDLIAAFEGAMIEIEFLAYKPTKDEYKPVVLVTFDYRTRPGEEYHKDSYQHKGPSHVGKIEVNIRTYGWTEEQIRNYVSYREEETLYLIGYLDDTLKDVIEGMDEEIKKYLRELNIVYEDKKKIEAKKEEEKKPSGSVLEPFVAIGKGFWEMTKTFTGEGIWRKKPKIEDPEKAKEAAKIATEKAAYNAYKFFKKSHDCYHW